MGMLMTVGLVLCMGAASANAAQQGATGLSTYPESRIVLAVADESICYNNITWTLFSTEALRYEITADGLRVANGTVQGVITKNTILSTIGLCNLKVTIGQEQFSWRVILINESTEDWVGENIYGMQKNIHLSSTELFWIIARTLAITMVFFFAPFPLVFQYVVKRKEMEARQLV